MILMATHKNLTLYFILIVLSTFGADSHKGQASLNLRVAKGDLLLLAPILLAQQPRQCLAFGSVVSPGLTEANGTAWEAGCFLYNDHYHFILPETRMTVWRTDQEMHCRCKSKAGDEWSYLR